MHVAYMLKYILVSFLNCERIGKKVIQSYTVWATTFAYYPYTTTTFFINQ